MSLSTSMSLFVHLFVFEENGALLAVLKKGPLLMIHSQLGQLF